MLFKILFLEWPLVFFTLLAQSALGIALIYTILIYFKKVSQKEESFIRYIVVFGLTMLIGLIFAVLHLSNPFNGIYILSRILFSVNGSMQVGWLPLEVILLGLSVVVSAVIYYLSCKKNKDELITRLLYVLPILGFLGLIFMTGIYGSMSVTVPVWNFWLTFLIFFISCFILGATLLICLFNFNSYIRKLCLYILTIAYILLLVVFIFKLIFITQILIVGVNSVFDIAYGYYGIILFIGLLLTAIPIFIINFMVFILDKEVSKSYKYILSGSILIGMIFLRVLFYALINTNMFL